MTTLTELNKDDNSHSSTQVRHKHQRSSFYFLYFVVVVVVFIGGGGFQTFTILLLATLEPPRTPVFHYDIHIT